MKVNKKGFTLIELLVAIVLMLSISALAIVAYSNMTETNRKDQYNSVEEQIKTATEQYLANNSYILNSIESCVAYIPLRTLVENDYLKALVDPTTKEKLKSCSIITVKKDDGEIDISYSKTEDKNKCESNYIVYKTESSALPVSPIKDDQILEYSNVTFHEVKADESIGDGTLTPTVNKWYNSASFSDTAKAKEENINGEIASKDKYLYVCVNFKTGSNCGADNDKECAEVDENVNVSFDGLTYDSKKIDTDKNRICALFINDFDVAERNVNISVEDDYSHQVPNFEPAPIIFGKDTVAPVITMRDNCFSPSMGLGFGNMFDNSVNSDCNHIHIDKGALTSYLSSNIPKNLLYFKSQITDNIELDKIESDSTTTSLGPSITGTKVSKEFIVSGMDVTDKLLFNPSSTSNLDKYGYQVNLKAFDKAGNMSVNDTSIYGYISCNDTNQVRENVVNQVKFCLGKSMITYHNNSLYDNGMWPTKFLCSSNRSYEVEENNSTCVVWQEIKTTIWKLIKCWLADVLDWFIGIFTGESEAHAVKNSLCPSSGEIVKEEKSEKVEQKGGTFGFTVEVLNGSTLLYAKDYSRSNNSSAINKNDSDNINNHVAKKWFNAKDFPNGITLKVRLGGGIKSYSYSLSQGSGYKKIGNENSSDNKSNVTYENPQQFTYNITSDGKDRVISLNVKSEDGDNVSLNLTFSMDRTKPEVTASNITRAKCGGADGVSSTLKVTDITSKPQVVYYYFGNDTQFDNSIESNVSHVKGSGSDTITYTDTWSSGCKISRCTGGKCINVAPAKQKYKLKVRAYDNAGNTADGFSNYASW